MLRPLAVAEILFVGIVDNLAVVGELNMSAGERTVGIDQILGNEKQRDALGSRRCVRQPRQHEMNDIIGKIVLTV